MLNHRNIFKFLAVVIFSLALILRFWNLGSNPAGFDADEAAFGYNSYSILKTASDEYGKFLPITLKSFGEYKPALYSYLTVPFVQAFGLNPFAVRFASALFGLLTVIIFYFFVLKLSRNVKIALLSAFLIAISPWHINLSRTASEVIVSLFLTILFLYSLISFKESKSKKWLVVSLFSILFSVLSYTASRLFIPLLFILFLFYFREGKEKVLKTIKPYYLIILFILVSIALYTLADSASRIKQINIFQHPETRLKLEEQIRENSTTSALITRTFHNKPANFTRTILENYGHYFTLDYLFLSGGQPQRMNVPNSGLFYIWQLPFIVFGIYVLFKNRNKVNLFIITWWILLLLPISMTFDEIPNVYRSLIVLPPIVYACAMGLYTFFRGKFSTIKKLLLIFIVAIAVWEFSYYQLQYYVRQETHRPWYRGYSFRELVSEISTYYNEYDKIVVTKAQSSPYIYILFYTKFDPKKYQAMGSPRDIVENGGFDKFIFTPVDCPLSAFPDKDGKLNGEENVLYVNNGNCPTAEKNVRIVKTIKWGDGTDAFKLLEYLPPK